MKNIQIDFNAKCNKFAAQTIVTVLTNPIGAIATTTMVLGTMNFVNENMKDKRKYKKMTKEETCENL